MRKRVLSTCLLALVLLSGLPACRNKASLDEYDIDATRDKAVELLGGGAQAAYAVLQAYDDGFAPSQIAQSIHDGKLTTEGKIEGAAPAGEKQGRLRARRSPDGIMLAYAGGSADILADAGGSADFQGLFEGLDDEQSSRWLAWILGSTASGYSTSQVLEYVHRRVANGEEPEDLFGLPIIMDEDGELAAPELDNDWPYAGRAVLGGAVITERLDAIEMLEVLTVGLVNAGYSNEQIWQGIRKWDSVGLAESAGSEDGASSLVPCIISNGEILKPQRETRWNPETVVVDKITPDWATRGQVGEAERAIQSRTITKDGDIQFKLTPTFANPSMNDDRVITKHEIALTLKRHDSDITKDSDAAFYEVYCDVMIEFTATKDEETHNGNSAGFKKGDRWVTEGQIFPLKDERDFGTGNLLDERERMLTRPNSEGVFTLQHIRGGAMTQETENMSLIGAFDPGFTGLSNGTLVNDVGAGQFGLKVSR